MSTHLREILSIEGGISLQCLIIQISFCKFRHKIIKMQHLTAYEHVFCTKIYEKCTFNRLKVHFSCYFVGYLERFFDHFEIVFKAEDCFFGDLLTKFGVGEFLFFGQAAHE